MKELGVDANTHCYNPLIQGFAMQVIHNLVKRLCYKLPRVRIFQFQLLRVLLSFARHPRCDISCAATVSTRDVLIEH